MSAAAAVSALPAFLSLSFITRVKRGKRPASTWNIPAPSESYIEAQRICPDGDKLERDDALYNIGCQQGAAAAHEYLTAMRRSSPIDDCGGWLQRIALEMFAAERTPLLRGQIVGFFTEIEATMEGKV
ncbi:hypothetical protein FHW12_000362 [Dokdonella fugitiva]|uniref:Uncharacterized protein n=1 Tax=Dokdonella fugitiva TaxID=328517 RepID=A0A839F1R6_9GAMM|nr:hypothetical protein [Dokdonella fugitiva]MBA8886171.1 hypothetical protein [Dokdonella fugitiva]